MSWSLQKPALGQCLARARCWKTCPSHCHNYRQVSGGQAGPGVGSSMRRERVTRRNDG